MGGDYIKVNFEGQQWWHMPLVPELWRLRQMDLCEFKASLVYIGSLRTVRAT